MEIGEISLLSIVTAVAPMTLFVLLALTLASLLIGCGVSKPVTV